LFRAPEKEHPVRVVFTGKERLSPDVNTTNIREIDEIERTSGKQLTVCSAIPPSLSKKFPLPVSKRYSQISKFLFYSDTSFYLCAGKGRLGVYH